jgi:hypothetical protein
VGNFGEHNWGISASGGTVAEKSRKRGGDMKQSLRTFVVRLAAVAVLLAGMASTTAAESGEPATEQWFEHADYGLIRNPPDCSTTVAVPDRAEIEAALASGEATILSIDEEPVDDLTTADDRPGWLKENRIPTAAELEESRHYFEGQDTAPAEGYDEVPTNYCFDRWRDGPSGNSTDWSTEVPTSTLPALAGMGGVLFSHDYNPDYQSDRVMLSDHGAYRAVEHLVYVPTTMGSGETNQCDNPAYPYGCFWFAAIELNTGMAGTNTVVCGGHMGPIRGYGHTGWDANFGYYCDGGPVGGNERVYTDDVPTNKWVTVKMWRKQTIDFFGLILSEWETQLAWDTQSLFALGSDWYVGDSAVTSGEFVELWEPGDPCSTDLGDITFTLARYWPHGGGSPAYFADGTADYQHTCDETVWDSITYYITVVIDRRNTAANARSTASPHPVLW